MAAQSRLDSAYGVAVASPTPAPLPTPNAGLSLDATSAGLTQVSGDTWETTLLMSDTASRCRGTASFVLETSGPQRQITGIPVDSIAAPSSFPSSAGEGSDCQEFVIFKLPQVPASATLLFTSASGKSTTISVTLSRRVTAFQYLGAPTEAGLFLALLLVLTAVLLTKIYDDGRRVTFASHAFWMAQSKALTISNTWSANISTIFGVVGVILTVSTAEAALFPGVATDRFIAIFVIAAIIAITAPLVFRLLYIRSVRLTRRNLSLAGGATVTLPEDNTPAFIEMACGGSILFPAGAMAHEDEGGPRPVKPAARVLIPPGCAVEVHSKTMVFPGSTADAAVHAYSDFTISGITDRFTIPRSDLAVRIGPRGGNTARAAKIETDTGAVISALGAVNVRLPHGSRVEVADRQPVPLEHDTIFQVPDTGEATATMGLVLIQAAIAMFGVGAMLGVISVLVYSLSVLDEFERILVLVVMVAFGLGALYYSLSVIRSQFPQAT